MPTGIVNLARRYSHSPVATLAVDDALGALRLVEAVAHDFSAATDLAFLTAGSG